MIGMLTGHVRSVGTEVVILEVQGVGFELRMPVNQLARMHTGERLCVHTCLNVSQDSLTLYGFVDEASKTMFLRLQKVSGIGPKVALSILSVLDPDALTRAIAADDVRTLSQAPGLGKKGAQKIILELKGSIDLTSLNAAGGEDRTQNESDNQVIQGLMSLGWREQDAVSALQEVCERESIERPIDPDAVSDVLRLALASLDRGR